MEQTYTVTAPDQKPTQADLAPMIFRAENMIVSTQEEYETAMLLMGDLRRMEKQVKALFADSKVASNKAHKAVCAAESGLLNPIKIARSQVDVPCAKWEAEQRRIAQEEQRRLEAEARKEDEEARLRDAEAAEEAGDHQAAEEILNEPAAPVVVKQAAPAKVAGVSTVRRYSAEVVSLAALAQYAIENDQVNLLLPNQPSLNKMAVALKGEMRIPGVKVVLERGRAFRG